MHKGGEEGRCRKEKEEDNYTSPDAEFGCNVGNCMGCKVGKPPLLPVVVGNVTSDKYNYGWHYCPRKPRDAMVV